MLDFSWHIIGEWILNIGKIVPVLEEGMMYKT